MAVGQEERRALVLEVYAALEEQGGNPLKRLNGYLLTGDPACLPYRQARLLVGIDHMTLLCDMVEHYLHTLPKAPNNKKSCSV